MRTWQWFVLWCALGFAPLCGAGVQPSDASLYVFQQRPGVTLPTNALFRDSDGRALRIGELAQGRPLVLVLGYFNCTSLCGLVRSSLYHALAATELRAGRDYSIAVLSIDPQESSEEAGAAKASDRKAFGLSGSDSSVHYLTGSAAAIRAVADAVGFRARLDQPTGQFMHPAGLVFVTSTDVVSNYLLGVGYTPAAVRSAIERAGAGAIAARGLPLLLICFHFDPSTGRYSLEVLKVIRLGAMLTAMTLAGLLWLLFRRERAAP